MPNRLIGPREKVKRAKQHVEQFDAEQRAFLESHPYGIGTKRVGNGGIMTLN